MDIRQYDTAQHFLETTKNFLMQKEAANNLPLGILYRLAAGKDDGPYQTEPLLAVVESDGFPIMTMVMTPPRNLVISGDGPNVRKAIPYAVSFLKASGWHVPGVIGERDHAEAFSGEWARQTGSTPVVQMEQGVYRLDSVHKDAERRGQLRMATMSDLTVASDWIYAFSHEAIEPANMDEAYELAEGKIRDGALFLWEDEQVVSMAAKSRATDHGATVSLVYTPPEFRQKGYASSCVAALSQRLLDEGYQFCSLYTDLANPTSNKIYTEIGYRRIGDSVVYEF